MTFKHAWPMLALALSACSSSKDRPQPLAAVAEQRLCPPPAQPPGAAGRAAQEDGFSFTDRLLATEQAIQLDELIKWVNAQAGLATTAEPEHGN